MATFVHIAPESLISAIKRSGIAATRFPTGHNPRKGVFCFPVLPDFFHTHQWLHELRRRSREKLCGIYFRIPDTHIVHLGRFGKPHQELNAVEAIRYLQSCTALGIQVIVPRSVSRQDVLRIKPLPQIVGWRLYPEAKGTQPLWPSPGTFGADKLRKQIEDKERREEERYFSRFPADWYTDE